MFNKKLIPCMVLLLLASLWGGCGMLKCDKTKVDVSSDFFNGKDLTGWEILPPQSTKWSIEDGMLVNRGGSGGWIVKKTSYSNFVLDFDFLIPSGGNSGVFLRAPIEGNPAYNGMEIQICDDYSADPKTVRNEQLTGSIYDVVGPSSRATLPGGQWQHMKIKCVGRNVQVTINGTKVVDANLDDYKSKFEHHPGLTRTEGFIGFQDHTLWVKYRNIRLTQDNYLYDGLSPVEPGKLKAAKDQ